MKSHESFLSHRYRTIPRAMTFLPSSGEHDSFLDIARNMLNLKVSKTIFKDIPLSQSLLS